jgi:outer membrane protein assembly factor BamB
MRLGDNLMRPEAAEQQDPPGVCIMRSKCLIVGSVVLCVAAIAQADDWPQWRGPNRAGDYNEPGLLEALPEGGLAKSWSAPCGYGYAGPAVADGKVFLFDYVKTGGEITNLPSRRDQLTGKERLRCFDAKTGKPLWSSEYDRSYNVSYPGGPRATPTVAGDYVYTFGVEGDLTCFRIADGQQVWQVEVNKDYGVETPIWGHSAPPLVVDDTVVAVVGGRDALVVAFDTATGSEKWKALSADEPGYCGPTLYEQAGQKSLLVFYPLGVAGLDVASGQVKWKADMRPSFGMSIATPLQNGSQLFVSGYGESMMVELGDSATSNRVVWRGKPNMSIAASNATPYFADGVIYGCDIESSAFVAIDPATGQRLWQTKQPTLANPDARGARHGTAFLVRHTPSGRYLLFNESGELIVAELSTEKYNEIWRAKIVEPTSDAFGRPVVWSHPAYAEGCIFARNDRELVCAAITGETN